MNLVFTRSSLSGLLAVVVFATQLSPVVLAENQAPSAEVLVKTIEKSAIFPADQKVQARVNGVEALISTYKDKASKDSANDCKISSVLVARELINKFPDLVRVKVKFFDPLKLGASDTVSVTVGDVTAFSSGQTSTDKLLASLELHHEQESSAPANLRPIVPSRVTSSGTASRNSVYGASSKFMPISAAGAVTDLVGYIQRDLDMKLAYPKGWTLVEKPDAATLFNLTINQDSEGAVVQAYASPKIPGSSLEQFARLTFDTYLKPTKGCRLNATKAVRFGKDGCIEGICQEISIPFNGAEGKAAFYYFLDGGKIVLFQCIATESWFAKIEPSFNSIMLSVVPGTVRSAAASASRGQRAGAGNLASAQPATQGASRDGYVEHHIAGADVSFKYPASWKIQSSPDANTVAKFTGLGPQNKYGELTLASGDFPNPAFLEIHANNVEEQWQHSLKDSRKLGRAHVSAHGCEILRDALSANQNGVTTIVQFGHFCHEGKLYSFVAVGPGWPASDAQVFFDRILSSVTAR